MALKYLVDLNLSGNELQNAAIQTLESAPESPSAGQIYYNTAQKGLFVYSGTSWGRVGLTADGTTISETGGEISVVNNSHSHTVANVTGLQTLLDGKVDDSQVLTDVPANAVFTDTLFSAGDGISLSGTTFSVAGGDGLTQEASGLKVDSSVVRTSGDQTIGGDKTFSNNVIVSGNLTVSGTTTTVNSTQVTLADNILTLASNAATAEEIITAGIEVNRGEVSPGVPEEKASLFYKEETRRWYMSMPGVEEEVISLPGEFDTNTQRTDEEIRTVIGATLVEGGATTITIDDPGNTITISSTDTQYSAGTGLGLTGTTFSNPNINSYIILEPLEEDTNQLIDTALPGPSVSLQVKELDDATGVMTMVMTDWTIDIAGAARVFLPANATGKRWVVSWSGTYA